MIREPKPRAAAARRLVLAIVAVVLGLAWASVGGGRTRPAVPGFGRIVVVVFENKGYHEVIGSPAAPTFNGLARRYALLTNYTGVAHPSLPNYLALVSGSTHGIDSNCTDCTVSARSLADTLEAASHTWKTYAEGLPKAGFVGAESGRYAKRHDPFVYFESVLSRPARIARVVPLTQLGVDLRKGALPDFSLVIPDLCHDMHDCSVADGDTWLASFLPPLLKSPQMKRGVAVLVFDEASRADVTGGGGHVPAVVVGPLVRRGARLSVPLNHYSLLRTIEDAWHLPRLGSSAGARAITGIWLR